MITTKSMRFTGILQREFLPQKRRLPVSYTPGTEHFHNFTPFVAMRPSTLGGARVAPAGIGQEVFNVFSKIVRVNQSDLSVEAVNGVAFRQ
jgi:hypothetical protein